MTKEALIEDKERIDKYAGKIAHQEPVKEWMVIYALLVAVGWQRDRTGWRCNLDRWQ